MNNDTEYSYENTYIKTNKFEGVIFSKDYTFFGLGKKFTPSINEIELAEKILRKKIKEINQKRVNQNNRCPVIHEKLRKYKRQYFGYIDEEGDKIIYINSFWDRSGLERLLNKASDNGWKREYKSVCDGCSYYWSIKVNLKKNELMDLDVNGSG